MHRSYVVDIDGNFAGAALTRGDAFRFVAVDERLESLDGRLWPTLAELRAAVRRKLPPAEADLSPPPGISAEVACVLP